MKSKNQKTDTVGANGANSIQLTQPVSPVLPATGYLNIKTILGDKNANPPRLGIIPVSNTSWWRGIRDGRFPKPIKLTKRTNVWKVEDIKECLLKINKEGK
ncbi:MAG: AlpA family phage regulatory protein [Magnetococcus sp. DMHC-1]